MYVKIITGVFMVLLLCSCKNQISKSEQQNQNLESAQIKFKSGLTIKNRINRGINYTDALGTPYSVRNIPVKITNDTTVAIHVKLVFSKKYNYPHPNSNEMFRLIPLSGAWAQDGGDITESMMDEIPRFIANPIMETTIKPNESFDLSIASIYPRPARTSGVLPRTLFALRDTTNFPNCDWLIDKDGDLNQLGLKLVMGEHCRVVPCGSISYIGHINIQ